MKLFLKTIQTTKNINNEMGYLLLIYARNVFKIGSLPKYTSVFVKIFY
jgi:hypothetical protein